MYSLQDRQLTYNVTLWRAGVTIVQRKHTTHTTLLSVYVVIVELRCYSQLYNMLSVAQQCVYGTLLKENSARLWIVENNICLFVAFIRRIVCLYRSL